MDDLQRIQHSLNNSLTSLLAEAQLLALEDLAEEHAAAVDRMVQLCLQMATLTKALGTLSGPSKAS